MLLSSGNVALLGLQCIASENTNGYVYLRLK